MPKKPLTEEERASLRTDINLDALERYLDAVSDGDREFMLALLKRLPSPEARTHPRLPEQVVGGLAGPTTLRWSDPELQALYEAIFRAPEP